MNINDFKYAWRFTDKNHAEFSSKELCDIKIIGSGETRTKWDKIVKADVFERSSFIQSIVAMTAPVFISDCGWGDIQAEHKTKQIISEYFKENNVTNIALLYDNNTALQTSVALFCERWSDFFYPNDSIVIALDSGFMIYYEDILYGAYR